MEAEQSPVFLRILIVEIAVPCPVMEKWYGPFSDLALIPLVWLPLLSSLPFISVFFPSSFWLLLRLPSDGRILGSNYFFRFEFFQDSTALRVAWSAFEATPPRCHYGFKSLCDLWPWGNIIPWMRSFVHPCLFTVLQWRHSCSAAHEGITRRWCNSGVILM